MSTTLSSSTLRWGLVGPGRIAEQFAVALDVIEDSCLYAVLGRSKAKAESFASRHGAAVCHYELQALLEDPGVDAVYIATPHRYHFEQARECLLAGKPVVCEKPLTVNARQAQELIDLSRKQGVFLMEALWTRFLPIYREISHWLLSGRIGKVTSVTSSFGFAFPRNPSDRLLNRDLAGGALLDMGVYNLSMSQWVFGEQPVDYSTDGSLGETGVDEYGETTLRYSGGRTSRFKNSMISELDNDLVIHGSEGHIRVDPMFWSATRAAIYPRGNGKCPAPSVSLKREFRATGLEYQIETAGQCIRSGLTECPDISHKNTLDTLNLMDAMRHNMGLRYDFE